jgi:ABC-type multidrug transport system fused ATPase/permease subunit
MKEKFPFPFSKLEINIQLLIFLILFLNVKFVVKVVAILFILLWYRNWAWGFSFKKSRLPLFYLAILILEFFKYLFVTRNFGLNYGLVFCMGMLQWTMSLLAIHHLKLVIEQDSPTKVHNTIKAFFILNGLVSLFFLLLLVFHPTSLAYWGHGREISFGSPSAGDTILGITFDTSTVNATINCLGLIYFLYKRDIPYAVMCMIVTVLCTSNVTFLLIFAVLFLMVVTVRSKQLRLRVLVALLAMPLCYLVVSRSNREYIRNYFVQLYIMNKDTSLAARTTTVEKVDSITGKVTLVETPAPISPGAYAVNKGDLKTAFSNLVTVTKSPAHKESSSRIDSIEKGRINDSSIYPVISETVYRSKPGKLISFIQTYAYLKMNARHLLLGSGMGNFSSKLAFRVSGENITGTYPEKYRYIAPEFRYNHLKTYQFYAHSDASKHSVLNFPFSVYNQLLGEYGLIGAALFGLLYLGYFAMKYRRLSYGRYMMIILLGFFLMEFWFELFSLVVVFELFLLLNIREGRIPGPGREASPDVQPVIQP